jgi:hypothetical protein
VASRRINSNTKRGWTIRVISEKAAQKHRGKGERDDLYGMVGEKEWHMRMYPLPKTTAWLNLIGSSKSILTGKWGE